MSAIVPGSFLFLGYLYVRVCAQSTCMKITLQARISLFCKLYGGIRARMKVSGEYRLL